MIQNLSTQLNDAMNIPPKDCQRKGLCFLSIIVVLFFPACEVVACRDEPTADIQKRCSKISQQLQSATVRIRSGSDVSSGVIVSADGLVLTVAHGLKADAATTVIVSSSQVFEAKQVFVDATNDIALVSIDLPPSNGSGTHFLSLSTEALSTVGETVLAAGFPAREPDGMMAVIRLGEILAVDGAAIRTNCTLTSGDSGGPLVNSRSELIGLNRQIGKSAESNGHIQMSAILRALKQADLADLAEKLQQIRVKSDDSRLTTALLPTSAVARTARQATVEIYGTDRQGEVALRACGTMIDAFCVATKLSEIVFCENLELRFSDGSKTVATLSKQDRDLDLAILTMKTPSQHGDIIQLEIAETANDRSPVGTIVFTAKSPIDVSAAGIISRVHHEEPSMPARFGAAIQADFDRVRVTDLSPNGSAANAGVKTGDELLRVDEKIVNSLTVIGNLLQPRQPGDWITLDIQRGENRLRLQAQLQHDPGQQFSKTEYLDGRAGEISLRRSGFRALQHDIAIAPAACGGPLLDINGRIIGINIARRARESTLALPVDIVVRFADNER